MKRKYIILTTVLALFAILFALMLTTESVEIDENIHNAKEQDTKDRAEQGSYPVTDTIFDQSIREKIQSRPLPQAELLLRELFKENIRKNDSGRGKTGEAVKDSVVYEYLSQTKILFSTRYLKPITRIVLSAARDPHRTSVRFVSK